MAGNDETQEKSDNCNPKIEKVREWLNAAGYPLEMRVARRFARHQFTRVVQGDVYKSRDRENTYREIDVSAQLGQMIRRSDEGKPSIFFDLFTVCECKSNAKGNRPWLVFTDENAELHPKFRLHSHRTSELGDWLLAWLALEDRILTLDLFNTPRVGYAIRCATLGSTPRENNQDPAYEAVMQVLDAAREKAAIRAPGHQILRVVLPLIVVDADLYECWLDGAGELKLEPRDEMALAWKRPGFASTGNLMIYIVTEAKLPAFISRLETAHSAMAEDHALMERLVEEYLSDQPPDDGE